MILAALGPVGVVVAIFVGTLFPPKRLLALRSTTKAERQFVAARAQRWRKYAVLTALVVFPLFVVAAIHLTETAWVPLELS